MNKRLRHCFYKPPLPPPLEKEGKRWLALKKEGKGNPPPALPKGRCRNMEKEGSLLVNFGKSGV